MTELSPSEFLTRIWPLTLVTNETLELRAINRIDGTIRRKFCTSIKDILFQAKQFDEYEIYFGVSTRFGERGKKNDCYRTKCLWVDLDKVKMEDVDLSPNPDYIVNSGSGIHAYWCFKDPILVRWERWREIESWNRGLCKKFGGDIAAIDCSRILRIPGFINHKYSSRPIVRAYAV